MTTTPMKTPVNSITLRLLGSLLLATGLVGCGQGTQQNGFQHSDQQGRLSFRMIDAPGDAAHLWVNVEQISLKNCQGGGWIDTPTASAPFDLMTLAEGDAFRTLSQAASIPLGTYCETRLVLGEEATVETEEGESYPLKVPSGESSGYKIKGEYQVKDDALTVVTLDFDAKESLHKAGNSGKYILRPVVFIAEVVYLDFPVPELHYSDHLRERLQAQGSNEVQVQVSLVNWESIPAARELLALPGAPIPSFLYGKNALPDGRLEPTLEVSSKDLSESALNAELEKLASYAGKMTSAEANAMAGAGADASFSPFALRGTGTADQILSWWDDNPDRVRLVQTILNDTDNAQRLFFPGIPVK